MKTNFEFKSVVVTNDIDEKNSRIISANFSDGKTEKSIKLVGSGNLKEIVKI